MRILLKLAQAAALWLIMYQTGFDLVLLGAAVLLGGAAYIEGIEEGCTK